VSLHGRHWLVTPSPAAWSRLMRARPELAAEKLVAGWGANAWPLVRRRPLCSDRPSEIPLGLPLPPSHGKRRIALTLPEADLLGHKPPPYLADCRYTAPPHWQAALEALLALDGETQCFGGLAWQHITGLPYLSAQSDLDLLWHLPSAARLAGFLAALARIGARAPMRIDGEIIGPRGAVQWRELAAGEAMLAVKGEAAVTLIRRDVFLQGAGA
jgi:malonate decarboxylase holo-[acyl-carrier-protein] synthase